MRNLLACALLLLATPAWALDPLEPWNRRIHSLNRDVQTSVLDPLAQAYRNHTSPGFRAGVSNALANLREPITAVAGLAAGDVKLSLHAATRFGINSSLGLAGVQDRAAEYGYPRREFGLADAACHWGVPAGPFLVLPLLGPSTLRDAGAMIAANAGLGAALGPPVFLPWRGTDVLHSYTELSEQLARVDEQSLDAYAVYRSAYLQRRAAVCPGDRGAEEE